MANISFVLQSNFNSKQQSIRLPSFPIKLRTHSTTCPNFKIQCLMTNPNRKPQSSDVNQVICRNVLKKPVITGVLLGLLDHHHGCVAMAGSRGRMSGSSVSSSSSSSRKNGDSVQFADRVVIASGFLLIFSMLSIVVHSYPSPESSIIKLQVGLLGTATSLQKSLNQDAESVSTSTPRGFRYRLKGATLSLLEHLHYCVSAYSSVEIMDVDKTQERFDQLLVEERAKEALVNANNIRKPPDGVPKEYIVVTIIVATSDVQQLPDSAQLTEALQKVDSIPSYKIMAAEVLWTPQHENDCLTEGEFIKHYPLLQPL